MTTTPVDAAGTYSRISRAVRAAMAARDIKDFKQLAAVTGIKYDTLLRRIDGKPWLVHEIIAVADALEVDYQTLLNSDPDDWFRPPAAAPTVTHRDIPAPVRRRMSATRRDSVYIPQVTAIVAA